MCPRTAGLTTSRSAESFHPLQSIPQRAPDGAAWSRCGMASSGRERGEREIGIGVVGFGWMGRVHTSSYRRVVEHFPDLGVRRGSSWRADVAESAPAPGRAPRLRRDDGRLARGGRAPRRRAREHHDAQQHAPRGRRSPRSTPASTCGWRSRSAAASRTPPAVAEAARRAGVVTGVGFCYRFAPAVQHARRPDRGRRGRRGRRTTAASSWPTTPTAPTPRRPGASCAPTPARARWATSWRTSST